MKRSRYICLLLLLTALFYLGLSLLCASYTINSEMGHMTIEQILFHLRTPMEGISPTITRRKHEFFLWMSLYSFIYFAYAGGWIGHLCRQWKSRWNLLSKHCLRVASIILYLLWFITIAFISHNHNLINYLRNRVQPSTMFDEHYEEPSPEAFRAPEHKRNLVLIISESLEQTYDNAQAFGDNLIPELTALQKQNGYFAGQLEVNGTDNTIAATTAILYGIPRLLVGMEGWHNFVKGNLFSHSTSILHILRQHGYRIAHLQGGSARFADTFSLFEDFPDADICDIAFLRDDPEYKKLTEQQQHYDWGVNDRIMFKHARRKLSELGADTSSPFFMSISTIDTHYDYYVEPGEPRPAHDYTDSVRVQSRLLGEFIAWLQQQPFAENTTVVLLGDHYVMLHSISGTDMSTLSDGIHRLPPQGQHPQRTIYSCLINPVQGSIGCRRRQFASFDWAPTLLEAIGFSWPSRRFALGVSLFADTPTLLESVSPVDYERESRRISQTYEKIIRRNRTH